MAYEFNRNQVDANQEVSVTMLTGGANSPSIDLEQEIGGDIEALAAEIEIPVEALLTDAKNLFFAIEDSADNSSFSALDPAITTSVVGAGGVGNAAKSVRFRLSPATRRYIRVAQTADSTPGTLANDVTLRLLF